MLRVISLNVAGPTEDSEPSEYQETLFMRLILYVLWRKTKVVKPVPRTNGFLFSPALGFKR